MKGKCMSTGESDRQLLKWVAKAVGMKVRHFNDLQNAYWIDESDSWWNPLTNDGDALRLSTKLGISIVRRKTITSESFIAVAAGHQSADYDETETMYFDDPDAATRRAIVIAAAEIGRNMEWMTAN